MLIKTLRYIFEHSDKILYQTGIKYLLPDLIYRNPRDKHSARKTFQLCIKFSLLNNMWRFIGSSHSIP